MAYQWQDPVYASLYNGALAPTSAQPTADDLNSGAYLARLQAAEAAGQPLSSVALAGTPQAAAGYDWRAKFGGNNGWQNAYGLNLNAGDYASEADFMKAYEKGILAGNPSILGGVEQKADGSLFIGRDGGMKDDGNYYSGDLYDNGETMGRYVLTPDTHVRLTGKDGEVLYQGEGTGAGPELMDALSNGVNRGGKSTYNVQTQDASGAWNTVVKGDPGPGLLGNFLKAMAITGGAVLAGSLLLPALGAGAVTAPATAALGGTGTALGGATGALGAGLGTGAALSEAALTALYGPVVATSVGAAAGGLGAGALAGLGAGALAGGAALGGGGAGTGVGSTTGASSSSGATSTATALPGDIVVSHAPLASGLGAITPGSVAAGGAAAGGLATGLGGGAPTSTPTTTPNNAPTTYNDTYADILAQASPTGGVSTGAAVGALGALGAGTAAATGTTAGAVGANGVPETVGPETTVTGSPQGAPVGGLTSAGIAAGTGAAATGAGSTATPKSTLDRIVDYLQLGAAGSALLGGLVGGGGGGSGSGNGTIPAGLNGGTNPIFNSQLPTANIPGGVGAASNLGPRTMPDQDWTKYGAHPEQSFFKYVPQQAYTPAAGAQ